MTPTAFVVLILGCGRDSDTFMARLSDRVAGVPQAPDGLVV